VTRDVGFDPVHAESLRTVRYADPFSLLVAQLVCNGKRSPALAYRVERFGEQREETGTRLACNVGLGANFGDSRPRYPKRNLVD
jgi:hypothetical protein